MTEAERRLKEALAICEMQKRLIHELQADLHEARVRIKELEGKA